MKVILIVDVSAHSLCTIPRSSPLRGIAAATDPDCVNGSQALSFDGLSDRP